MWKYKPKFKAVGVSASITDGVMRLENWFITGNGKRLDFIQEIVQKGIAGDLIVKGPAGSGKTNLAIYRALSAKEIGCSYAIVVSTIPLCRMVAYGLEVLGLDKEKVNYYWAWKNRKTYKKTGWSLNINGHVYCRLDKKSRDGIDRNIIYLVTDKGEIREFRMEKSEYAVTA